MSVLGKHVSGVWGHGLGLGLLGSLGLVAAWSRKRVPNTVVQADCSVGPCWPPRPCSEDPERHQEWSARQCVPFLGGGDDAMAERG